MLYCQHTNIVVAQVNPGCPVRRKEGHRSNCRHPVWWPSGVNTTEEDKAKFLLGMKKYGLKGKKVSLSRVYEQMLKEYYADELRSAEKENREPEIPSLRSFRYWIKS